MSAKVKKAFAIALVLGALMSIFVPVTSADSQTWFLCPSHTLSKTAPGDGSVGVPKDNGYGYWDAEPAQCDLTMGAGTWYLYLHYNAPVDGTIDVYVRNAGTGAKLVETTGISLTTGGDKSTTESLTGISVDFSTGHPLVLHIVWHPGTGSDDLTVYRGEDKSRITSPSTDPGYPVPEMSTLVLFSVGLLALAGYVAYRRRNI